MKLILQKVKQAQVKVEDRVVGEIGKGLVIFLGIHKEDALKEIPYFVQKILNLRIFPDEEEKMNLSLLDVKGSVLLISQFTLYGNCKTGRRPSFTEAMAPVRAKELYHEFINQLKNEIGERVQTGEFGAKMEVSLTNSGPVTFILE